MTDDLGFMICISGDQGRSLPSMTNEELCERTMNFALRIIKMADVLPRTTVGQTVARQIVRSGTSVAANYRAALRAKSRADFVNKVTIVLEETDETSFWLEILERAAIVSAAKLASLRCESEELIKIFSATRRTARSHQSRVVNHKFKALT